MNDASVALFQVRGGIGYGELPRFLCVPSIRDGSLVAPLPEWRVARGRFRGLYPPLRPVPPHLRAWLELVRARLGTGSAAAGREP